MQPYLFPYVSYFQLVAAADCFVLYDDVQFIQRGYINRNELAFGKFTLPLRTASQGTEIRDRHISRPEFSRFRKKWERSFQQQYAKAPFRDVALDIAVRTWDLAEQTENLVEIVGSSIKAIADYLELSADFVTAGSLDYDRSLKSQERILALLATTPATTYINAGGGRALYEHLPFEDEGIQLRFLSACLPNTEEDNSFKYSILHVLANHSQEQCRRWVTQDYQIIP